MIKNHGEQDVYKRQTVVLPVPGLPVKTMCRLMGAEGRPAAVSYTHLDVYKRQELDGDVRAGGYRAVDGRTGGADVEGDAVVRREYGDAGGAVSYTHLYYIHSFRRNPLPPAAPRSKA